MKRALPTAALFATALASIATSQAYLSVAGRVALPEVDFQDGDLPLSVAVSASEELKVADITDARLELSLDNPTDSSALVELYLLDAPLDDAGIPDGLAPIGSVMVRGALDGEPGRFDGALEGGVDGARELHFALVSDVPEVAGSGELVLSAFFTETLPAGAYTVEVIR